MVAMMLCQTLLILAYFGPNTEVVTEFLRHFVDFLLPALGMMYRCCGHGLATYLTDGQWNRPPIVLFNF